MSKPTHKIVMKSKKSGTYSEIGVMWTNEGRYGDFFSINLNPGIVISHRDFNDHWFNAYPLDETRFDKKPETASVPYDPDTGEVKDAASYLDGGADARADFDSAIPHQEPSLHDETGSFPNTQPPEDFRS